MQQHLSKSIKIPFVSFSFFLWNLKNSGQFYFCGFWRLFFLSLSDWTFAFRVFKTFSDMEGHIKSKTRISRWEQALELFFLCSFFRECKIRKRSLQSNFFRVFVVTKGFTTHGRLTRAMSRRQRIKSDCSLWRMTLSFQECISWMNLVFVTCCVWCCTSMQPLARWGYSTLPQQTLPI